MGLCLTGPAFSAPLSFQPIARTEFSAGKKKDLGGNLENFFQSGCVSEVAFLVCT